MKYTIREIFDIDKMNDIINKFTEIFNISASIGEIDGSRIITANDRKLCTDFHRVQSISKQACVLSRTTLVNEMLKGKEFVIYKCKNGLVDAASAIKINNIHIGNFFIGQFFLGKPDEQFFLEQAQKYNFDTELYMKAVNEIPVFEKEEILNILKLVVLVTKLFGELGLKNIIQKQLTEESKENERRFKLVMDSLDALVYVTSVQNNEILFANKKVEEIFGNVLGKKCYKALQKNRAKSCEFCYNNNKYEKILNFEIKNTINDRWYNYNIRKIKWYDNSNVNICIATDITKRKENDEELAKYRSNLEKIVASRTEKLEEAMKKLEYLSFHDQLTGLYNRRFFEEELMRLDTKRNLPLTLIMFDVDGLKLINDAFGHKKGDELLFKSTNIVKNVCRLDDIISRVGGDEFVILLSKTDYEQAYSLIMRIRKEIKTVKLDNIDISISFGLATKESEDESISDIYIKAEDNMYKNKLVKSEKQKGNMIDTIIKTLHEKNIREKQHSERVGNICGDMGEILKLNREIINELKTAGLLHDIGKITLDQAILNNTGKLTQQEWKDVKSHPEIGYRILSSVNNLSLIAEYVLAHHERWDGKGYPKGLKGHEIPFISRIITLADAYDAMTSMRSYKNKISKGQAIEELIRNKGKQFDPELTDVFIELLETYS